jgi:hypothetical protein
VITAIPSVITRTILLDRGPGMIAVIGRVLVRGRGILRTQEVSAIMGHAVIAETCAVAGRDRGISPYRRRLSRNCR